MKITWEVYDNIKATIGNCMVETGGVLGAGCDDIIRYFLFDKECNPCNNAYTPNVDYINEVLETQWMPANIKMVGIVHSHKDGFPWPSCGDLDYGVQILNALDTVTRFYLPIVQCEAEFSINWFVVEPAVDGEFSVIVPDVEIVSE